MRWQLLGNAPTRRFVALWNGIPTAGGGNVTFQIAYYEQTTPTAWRFQYQTMTGPTSDGSSATVGMESLAGQGIIYMNNGGIGTPTPAGNTTYGGLAVGFWPSNAAPPWPVVPPPAASAGGPGGPSGPDDGNKSGESDGSHWEEFRERACGNAAGAGSSGAFLLLTFALVVLAGLPRRA
jgi:hypothetical protein